MRSKALLAIVVLFTWLAAMCASPVLAHACCKGASHDAQQGAAWAPCCVVQPYVAPATQNPAQDSTLDLPLLPTNTVLPVLAELSIDKTQSLLASQHVPDQSGRYLELRVLLN